VQIANLLGILDGMAAALGSAMPNEIANQLKERTMRFALRVMRLCRTLPGDWDGRFIADQLFRASARTSANYHWEWWSKSRTNRSSG